MTIKIVGEDVEIAVLTHEAAVNTAVVGVADTIEPGRIRHRQRTQQDSLHQRKDGGVRSDTESQRDDRRNRKSRRFAQLAYRVAKILEKRLHVLETPV